MKAEQFLTSLQCLGMQQLITLPIRVTKTTSSLIDHVYTTVTISSFHAGVIETDISDHFPIFVAFEHLRKASKTSHKKSVFRTFRNYDINKFHDDLGKIDWNNVSGCTKLNESYSVFYDLFMQVSMHEDSRLRLIVNETELSLFLISFIDTAAASETDSLNRIMEMQALL